MTKARASGSSSGRNGSGQDQNKGLGLPSGDKATTTQETKAHAPSASATKDRVTMKVSNQNKTAGQATASTSKGPSNKNSEVLTLLNMIGDRLIRSEKERDDLKSTVEEIGHTMRDMDGRTDNAEKAYLTLQNKMRQTEETADEIRELFSMQQKQAQKLAKAIEFADKLDSALQHQERMTKRLDRFAEDRLKLDHKLSKIEKTVTQTQKSIQAGALLPLELTDDLEIAATKPKGNFLSWATSQAAAQAVVLVLILATIVTTGYVIREKELSYLFSITKQQDDIAYNYDEPEAIFDRSADLSAATDISTVEAPAYAVAPGAEVPAMPADKMQQNAQPAQKTIQDLDLADLARRFEEDPQAVAAELNKIEPAIQTPTKPAAPKTDVASMETKAIDITASQTPAKGEPKNPPFNLDAFLKSQTPDKALTQRTTRNTALPDMAKTIEDKAFNGVPTAQHDLGVLYSAGHANIPVDFDKAFLWFKESALQGVPNARYNLGVLYHQGLGVEQDMAMALNWYRAAAVLDHQDAQYNLGIAHIEGVGTKYDPKKAAEYFVNAAESGVMEAAYNLGLIHENGLLGKPSTDDAIYWYSEAVAKNSQEAQTALNQLGARLNLSESEIKSIYTQKKRLKDAKNKQANKKEAAVKTPPAKKAATNTKKQTKRTEFKEALTQTAKNTTRQQELILKVQQQLYDKGLFPGPVNGQTNDIFADAITAYQQSRDLKVDGQPSNALLIHMIADNLGDVGSRE